MPHAKDNIPVRETGLSVLIPAYNEQQGVGLVVKALREELSETGRPFEILIVDDGSTDNTFLEAEAADARVIRHATNRGYGAALKTGLRHVRYETVCITDADGTYPAKYIPGLVEQLARHNWDMVVGARTGQNVAIPLIRRPAKWAMGCFAEFMAGQPIPDLNSGLRVFSRKTVLKFLGFLPDGFSFTTTITLAMLSNGYLVHYEPIDYYARVGRSKIRPVRDTLNFVGLILRMSLYFAPLKIFLPLSGFLALMAIGWGAFSKVFLGQVADVSTIVIFMTAVQAGIVGLLAELISRRLPDLSQEER